MNPKTKLIAMKKLSILLLLTAFLRPEFSWGQGFANGLSEAYLQASLDVAKQLLTGPSYEDFKANYNTYGFNVGFYYRPLGFKHELQEDYGLPETRVAPHLSTLLASNNNLPGPTAPDPKVASFLSHVYPLIGIQLIGKGGSYSDRFGKSTTHLTYLEIPLYAMYGYKLPDGKGRVFGGLGFYFAYGLWGKTSYNDRTGNSSIGAFDKKSGGLRRFDAGLNFQGGYQLPQGLRLSLVYELGLVNLDPVSKVDKTFNRVFSLNVGYPLNKLVSKFKKQ